MTLEASSLSHILIKCLKNATWLKRNISNKKEKLKKKQKQLQQVVSGISKSFHLSVRVLLDLDLSRSQVDPILS